MSLLKNASIAIAAASLGLASTAVAAERPAAANALKVSSAAQPVRSAYPVAKKNRLAGIPVVGVVIGAVVIVVTAIVLASDDNSSPS